MRCGVRVFANSNEKEDRQRIFADPLKLSLFDEVLKKTGNDIRRGTFCGKVHKKIEEWFTFRCVRLVSNPSL